MEDGKLIDAREVEQEGPGSRKILAGRGWRFVLFPVVHLSYYHPRPPLWNASHAISSSSGALV